MLHSVTLQQGITEKGADKLFLPKFEKGEMTQVGNMSLASGLTLVVNGTANPARAKAEVDRRADDFAKSEGVKLASKIAKLQAASAAKLARYAKPVKVGQDTMRVLGGKAK
jgi:hypothetical protein